ncbi:restriction endonuclease subunit S [Rhodonellum sp.]|uniref:restriction endonuclease subunit S n=1 Tax=Rhodonellum sp. TaxID=2231180 RepID=UPI00271D75AF|nr:restriction endonuclease subunit S [Rhodonellum sp.]MDO9554640.1 restriction endonuclease subunit S [Rhodonellum sp.]
MKTNLDKYPFYKDSGVEWLGEIPKNWEIKKLKHISDSFPSNVDKHSKPNEKQVRLCNYTDVYKNEFISNEMNFMVATASNEQIQKFSLKVGDIIITKDSETSSDIAVPALVKEELKNVICGYHLAIVRSHKKVNPHFLFRLFQDKTFNAQFEICSNGITRVGLGSSDLKKGLILIPPLQEQTAIADFLDRKTTLIDQAISIKQKQIELLKERRQILIHKAVTRGLNPNVKLKDSGVEWVGEIPEGWEVKKLRYLANCFPSNIDKHSKPNEKEVRLCNYTDVYKNDYITNDMELMIATASNEQINKFTLKEGDIVITKDSETASDIAVPTYIKEKLTNVVCGYHLAIIRTFQNCYSRYLFQALKTKSFNSQFEVCSNGITRVGLRNSDLKNGYFLLPTEQEQIEIASYIENGVSKIAETTSLKEQEIEKLKEYKATVINCAVTGKIKVSGV